jgi:nitronate monooxygenase
MKLASVFPHPIVQGPMAGGANTPAMVAGVSNAGGLGSLAASLLTSATLCEQVGQIRALCDKPFAINLFVQQSPAPTPQEVEQGVALLKPVWSELGWDTLPLPQKWCESFDAQFDTLLQLKPAVASFTFNILRREQVAALHAAGILVIGTVTTEDEALAWQEVGADAVVASGIESGGHRGTFLVPQEQAKLSVWELGRRVCGSLSIPVILAGGIMTGTDIARALNIGAQAAQMGTAFLVTDESGIHPAYKQRLIEAVQYQSPTRLTRAFSGRYARGLDNRFMQIMAEVETQVPAYPVQNALTGAIRAHAAKVNDTELMSLWAGTQVHKARAMPVAELMATLLRELHGNLHEQ